MLYHFSCVYDNQSSLQPKGNLSKDSINFKEIFVFHFPLRRDLQFSFAIDEMWKQKQEVLMVDQTEGMLMDLTCLRSPSDSEQCEDENV